VTDLAELRRWRRTRAAEWRHRRACANAGSFPLARIEDMSLSNGTQCRHKLEGHALAVKACVPHLKKSAAGRIVITSSITGPITGFPADALRSVETGHSACAPRSSSRNTGSPLAVMPATSSPRAGVARAEYHKTMAASIPLKRLGTVEDIGYAALFLASKEAGYITGQTIVVDGGQILPESLEALKD
jgi:3-oxoacyl-[acyl-carrier protein] reductase